MPLRKVTVIADESCNLSNEKKYILKIEELKAEIYRCIFLLALHTHFLVNALRHFS